MSGGFLPFRRLRGAEQAGFMGWQKRAFKAVEAVSGVGKNGILEVFGIAFRGLIGRVRILPAGFLGCGSGLLPLGSGLLFSLRVDPVLGCFWRVPRHEIWAEFAGSLTAMGAAVWGIGRAG